MIPRADFDLPFREYLATPAISSHVLQKGSRSPEHLEWARNNRDTKETPALLMGRAVHCLTLTPELWDHEFLTVTDAKTRASKAYKEAAGQHPDKDLLLWSEAATATAVAEAVKRNKIAARATANADHKEVSLFWERDGIKCKARLDAIVKTSDKSCWISDLKTARSAVRSRGAGGERPFQHAVLDNGYHVQLAWYSEAVRQALGWEVQGAMIVAVEKEAPFVVRTYNLGEEWIRMGNRRIEEYWQGVVNAQELIEKETGQVLSLPVPSWAPKE